ncbi:hypothetical protein [Ligilactobacillus ceti]|nr:hypothetical protein [Ligilactobacillus ceti]
MQRKKENKIIIDWRHEYNIESIELDMESAKKWTNIDIEDSDTLEDYQKRVQEFIDAEYNRPEYNTIRKFDRHRGYSLALPDEDGFCDDEPLMCEVRDKSIFYKDKLKIEEKESREDIEMLIQTALKKDVADLVIAHILDSVPIREFAMMRNPREKGMTDVDYRELINRKANNLGHQLARAKKILKNIFEKTSDLAISQGYLLEGQEIPSKKKSSHRR